MRPWTKTMARCACESSGRARESRTIHMGSSSSDDPTTKRSVTPSWRRSPTPGEDQLTTIVACSSVVLGVTWIVPRIERGAEGRRQIVWVAV